MTTYILARCSLPFHPGDVMLRPRRAALTRRGLLCHERFGPNMTRIDLKVAQGAPHSCCDACLRGDSAWIGPVLHNCGASEPASDADPRQNAREATRNDEKRRETTRNDEKRRETKGNDGTARGLERPWSGRWTRHQSEGDLFTAPHLLIGCHEKSLHMRFGR